MTEPLSPAARALLDTARDADTPTPADKLRVQDSLYTKLGIAAGAGAAAGAAAAGGNPGPSSLLNATSATASTTAGVTVKVAVAVAAVTGLAIAGYYAFRSDDAGKKRQHEQSVVDREASTKPAQNLPDKPVVVANTRSEKPAVVPSNDDKQVEPVVEPKPVARPKPRARRVHRSVKVEAKPKENPLKAEKKLMALVQQALQDGDGALTLRLLKVHADKFPNGIFVPERQGSEVLALCKLGRKAAAKRAAKRFLSRWPRSLIAERVRRSCGN